MVDEPSGNNRKNRGAPRSKKRGVPSYVDTSQQDIDFYRKFGQRIKEIRERNKLTQVELAEKAMINRSYLSEVELGKRRVSLLIAFKLAKSLSTPLNDLLMDRNKE